MSAHTLVVAGIVVLLAGCQSCKPAGPLPPEAPDAIPGCTCADHTPLPDDGVAPEFTLVPDALADVGTGARTVAGQIVDLDGDGLMDTSTHRQVKRWVFQKLDIFNPNDIPANYNFHGIVAVDLDGDGDKDIVMAPYSTSSSPTNQPILLFRNEGAGHFVKMPFVIDAQPGDTALQQHLKNVDRWHTETIAAADIDGDGRVDLFVPFYPPDPNTSVTNRNNPGRSLLLINKSTAAGFTFSEEALVRNIPSPTCSKCQPEGVQFVDIDRDGDLDLVMAGYIYLNKGAGKFDGGQPFSAYGIAAQTDHWDEGLTVIDYNMDGFFDIYYRIPPTNQLLWRNSARLGLLHFTNDSGGSNLSNVLHPTDFAWGDAWGDFNGDGTPDLIFQYSDKTDPTKEDNFFSTYQPPIVLMNVGYGKFVAAPSPVATADGIAVGDIDGDGDLDLYLTTHRAEIWRNDTAFDTTKYRTLIVSPRDMQGRDNQHGATVHVTDKCDPSYNPIMSVGPWGTYLSLNQYDVQVNLRVGHCYAIDVQFMEGADGRPLTPGLSYSPGIEGGRLVRVRRGLGEVDPRLSRP